MYANIKNVRKFYHKNDKKDSLITYAKIVFRDKKVEKIHVLQNGIDMIPYDRHME